MFQFRCLAVLMMLSGVTGCCSFYSNSDCGSSFSNCGPPPARLVDVNTERGDAWGRNYYEYRTHELHPDQLARYDYHPRTYHRFVQDEDRG